MDKEEAGVPVRRMTFSSVSRDRFADVRSVNEIESLAVLAFDAFTMLDFCLMTDAGGAGFVVVADIDESVIKLGIEITAFDSSGAFSLCAAIGAGGSVSSGIEFRGGLFKTSCCAEDCVSLGPLDFCATDCATTVGTTALLLFDNGGGCTRECTADTVAEEERI